MESWLFKRTWLVKVNLNMLITEWIAFSPFELYFKSRCFQNELQKTHKRKKCAPTKFPFDVFWRRFFNWENLEFLQISFRDCFWISFWNCFSKILGFWNWNFEIKVNTKSNYKIFVFCILLITKKSTKWYIL